jgi:hypothetical protein
MIKFSLRKDGRFGDQSDRRHSGFADQGETRSAIVSGESIMTCWYRAVKVLQWIGTRLRSASR